MNRIFGELYYVISVTDLWNFFDTKCLSVIRSHGSVDHCSEYSKGSYSFYQIIKIISKDMIISEEGKKLKKEEKHEHCQHEET
jgi:hypothetical protein